MRYRSVSDIHSELWPENFGKVQRAIDRLIPRMAGDSESTLLLAGDTGSHRRRNLSSEVIWHLCDRFSQVIDIPGNHYWYGGTDWELCQRPVDRTNYHFGHTIQVDNVVPCTLWADFQRENPLIEQHCFQNINDFRQVPGLTPYMVKERHREHLAFLRRRITRGCVVMTHFAPSWRSVHERYGHDPLLLVEL